jgi:uncharacterized membrane protein
MLKITIKIYEREWNRKNMNKVSLIFVIFILCTNAAAAVFVQVDENGNATYTNIAPEGVKDTSQTTDLEKKQIASPAVQTEQFKISSQEQSARDKKRYEILTDELNAEKRAYAEAQNKHNDEEKEVHMRNITLLEKEIGIKK